MRMANQRKKNKRRKTLSAILVVLALLIAGAAVGVKLLRQRGANETLLVYSKAFSIIDKSEKTDREIYTEANLLNLRP